MQRRVEILDPFGGVMASGDLTVADVPGVDAHTPSVASEFILRIAGRRLTLDTPDFPHPTARYSIRVS